jgi:hypothetical protein
MFTLTTLSINGFASYHPARLILHLALSAMFILAMVGSSDSNCAKAQGYGEPNSRYVVINRVRISDAIIRALEMRYRGHIVNGEYWYDKVCGAWGLEGGPTLGFIEAGFNLGGPLRRDASRGNTGVFVNGRELHQVDVAGLQQLGPVYRGRYWVDAQGYVGFEGGPAFANLVHLAQAAQNHGGRKGSILSGMYDSGIGRVLGDGSYISGDSSVTRRY